MAGTEDLDAVRLEQLHQFSQAWTDGDVEALMRFVAGDCVYYASVGPEPGTTYRGREEVRRGFSQMLTVDRSRERHAGTAFVVGDVAVAEWSFEETTPDGRQRSIRGCDIFGFRDGLIVKKDAFRKVLAQHPEETVAGPARQSGKVLG